ncbi:MAG: zinc ribbon domain-containing protein [Erysipelotrichaceae bacterium]
MWKKVEIGIDMELVFVCIIIGIILIAGIYYFKHPKSYQVDLNDKMDIYDRVCPHCHEMVQSGKTHCPYCGEKL